MNKFALFLRGINVGKHNRITMAELKQALTEAGLSEIETYIQSGNILVTTRLDREQTEALAERAMETCGLKNVTVIALPWFRLIELAKSRPATEGRALVLLVKQPCDRTASLLGQCGGLNVLEAHADALIATITPGETQLLDIKKQVERPLGTAVTARYLNVLQDWVAKSEAKQA